MPDFDDVWTVHAVEPFSPFSTVLVFKARDPEGVEHRIAVDRRPARELLFVVDELGGQCDIQAPEPWQVLS